VGRFSSTGESVDCSDVSALLRKLHHQHVTCLATRVHGSVLVCMP
jgi:hypothetical protein